MSASKIPNYNPRFFNAKAKLVANVDFPTPPLALDIAIVNLVPLIGFFSNFLRLASLMLGFSVLISANLPCF